MWKFLKAANLVDKKAEGLSQLTLLTQPNSFWKTAGVKEKALAHLDEQLEEMLCHLGNAG